MDTEAGSRGLPAPHLQQHLCKHMRLYVRQYMRIDLF